MATTTGDERSETSKVIYKKHPLAIRWFHWINFPVLFVMIWSGLMIYWANQVFTIHLPFWHTDSHVSVQQQLDDAKSQLVQLKADSESNTPAASQAKQKIADLQHKIRFTLFPDSFFAPYTPRWLGPPFAVKTKDSEGNDYLALFSSSGPKIGAASQNSDNQPYMALYRMDGRLADGLAWHFMFAWFFAINGLLYVLFLLFSGEWRLVVPKLAAFKESIQVVLFDLHLTKKPLSVRKYNAAQQIAYTGVIFMGLLMLVTGIAIYKPSEQSWLTQLLGGYSVARFIHFWTTMGFLGFFCIHVGQVVKTGWNNFRGMLTGYELVTPSERDELRGNK